MTTSITSNETAGRVGGRKRSINFRERYGATLARTAVVVVLLAAWQFAVAIDLISSLYVSSPVAVFKACFVIFGDSDVVDAVLISLGEMAMAFGIATVGGTAVGFAIGFSVLLKEAFRPIVLFIMATPKIVFLPFFILIFGIGSHTRSFFGAFEAFPFVVVSVLAGVELIEEKHRKLAYSLNASRWQSFRRVLLPAALPGVITAIWYALRYAFAGVLMAGLFVSDAGIGYLVHSYTNNLYTDKLLALILVVSIVIILAASGWNRIERSMTRWREAGAQEK